MPDPNDRKPSPPPASNPPAFMGLGVAMGIALGAALGAAMDNLAAGIGAGLAIGAGIGGILTMRARNKK